MSACAFKRFLKFVVIDKRVLNPDSHRNVVANGMSTAGAVSQSLGNITITENQCSSKVFLSNGNAGERGIASLSFQKGGNGGGGAFS